MCLVPLIRVDPGPIVHSTPPFTESQFPSIRTIVATTNTPITTIRYNLHTSLLILFLRDPHLLEGTQRTLFSTPRPTPTMIDPPVHALKGLYTASVTNSFGLNDYISLPSNSPPNSSAGSAPNPIAPAIPSFARRRPPTPRCSSALYESTVDSRGNAHFHIALLNALIERVWQCLAVVLSMRPLLLRYSRGSRHHHLRQEIRVLVQMDFLVVGKCVGNRFRWRRTGDEEQPW